MQKRETIWIHIHDKGLAIKAKQSGNNLERFENNLDTIWNDLERFIYGGATSFFFYLRRAGGGSYDLRVDQVARRHPRRILQRLRRMISQEASNPSSTDIK